MRARTPGQVVARGTRSSVRAYGRGAVVKVPDPATSERWILAEAEHAEAARASGAPVPRLLGIERIEGRAASVWERVEGPSLWQHTVDMPARGAHFGVLLAEVHEALFGLPTPVTLPSQRDRLTTKIRRAAATIDAGYTEALALLPATPAAACLCHGDLHPSNVILSPRGPMIVDWFDASRGDPIADVARSTLVLLAEGADPPRHLPGADPATLERLTAAYIARMAENRDLPDAALSRWQAVNAVARMAEGVPRDALVDVWSRFRGGSRLQAATS